MALSTAAKPFTRVAFEALSASFAAWSQAATVVLAKVFNSAARLAIRGVCFNLAEACLTCSAKTLHEALVLRRSLRVLKALATVFFNFVPASLFCSPLLIAALRLSAELMGEQSDWTVVTSSIRPLQALKAFLQSLFTSVAFLSNSLGMQVLFTLSPSCFISGFEYIAQIAVSVGDSVLFTASASLFLKASIVKEQASSQAVVVSFNTTDFVLHSSVMVALHFPNSAVKFFRRMAPEFVPLPLQARFEEFPPPRAVSFMIKGAKLLALLALLFACLTNLSSLFFWASKFRTMSFFFM